MRQNESQVYQNNPYGNYNGMYNPNMMAPVDSGSIGYGILGCCLPIVGLILWLVWKDTKPRSAKKAGIGALISFGLWVIFWIAYFIIFAGVIATISTSAY